MLRIPPANENTLRLPLFKGKYQTRVIVASGNGLTEAVNRIALARPPSSPAAASVSSGRGSVSVAAAIGAALAAGAGEASVPIDDTPSLEAAGHLVRGSATSAVTLPLFICGIDGQDIGGGASLGAHM